MEMERRQSMVTKKVWKTIRTVLYMLTKDIACKSKLIRELLKRAKLAAAEAIANTLTLRHHYASSASISPHEYEFSCSNSPAIFPKFRNNKHHHQRRRQHQHQYDDVLKVIEILNNNRNESENYSSPSPMVALPGFGKSPIGRKVIRITDSPFPLKTDEGDYDGYVDVAAEEFIKRFYKQLNLQQNLVCIQSPSPYHNSSRDR